MLLKDSEMQQVAEAIGRVERETDAELVTVLARRADDYSYLSILWAALIALAITGVWSFSPWRLPLDGLLTLQWGLLLALALILRIPAVTLVLVPRDLKAHRAGLLARTQFLEQNLHHTRNNTGILIFVSEAEHYVEILADRGINQHVDADAWQRIVTEFTGKVRQGQVAEGFLGCIDAVGELMKKHVPATSEKNELPNHLVILD